MFKRRKQKPEWELEEIFQMAKKRLAEMESDPENFKDVSNEEAIFLADMTHANDAAEKAKKMQIDCINEAKAARQVGNKLRGENRHKEAEEAFEAALEKEREASKYEMQVFEFQTKANEAKTNLEVLSKRNALADQRAYVEELAKQRAAYVESQQKRKVSPDQKIAAGVTLVGFSAPYIIERIGKLANHIKGKVNLPRIWK